MKIRLLPVVVFPLLLAGCAGAVEQTTAAPDTPAAKPHMNMLQLMRAFPFPHSNVLFDAQGKDPEGAEKTKSMVFSVYRWEDSDVYAGWPGVENSALALAETANLLMVPGRLCANGKPAPVDREDWKRYSQGLIEAGEAAYRAAQSKDLDAIVEVTDKITDACSSCHDVYRDIDQVGKLRCTVPE